MLTFASSIAASRAIVTSELYGFSPAIISLASLMALLREFFAVALIMEERRASATETTRESSSISSASSITPI